MDLHFIVFCGEPGRWYNEPDSWGQQRVRGIGTPGQRAFLMSKDGNNSTPENTLDRSDPGDDIQMRFRYQHAYGVILLIAALSGKKPYTEIWCEHHDDYVVKKSDGKFDSFQVKTRQVGQPPWKMIDEPLVKSLKKFAEQNRRFPNQIDHFHFVSNHTYYRTNSQAELAKSPVLVKQAVENVAAVEELDEHIVTAIQKIADNSDYTNEEVFSVFKQLRLVEGPGLDDFNDVLAHTHLPTFSGCRSLSPTQLDAIRDELIHKVFAASSLKITDPAKHWCCVAGEDAVNPRLRAKRITMEDTLQAINELNGPPFRFAPVDRSISLDGSSDLTPLEKKAIRGGLSSYLPTWRRRALSAEQHLLEMASRKKNAEEILNQLDAVVKGECDDAQLQASAGSEPYGEEMMRIVQQELRNRASNRQATIYNQEYDCLIGIAGLLTNECEVWWSREFDLEETG